MDTLKTVPKNMNSVFATFRLSLFDSSQFLIFSKSSFTLKCNSDVDIAAAFSIVSSAYICGLVCIKQEGRSLIYIRNNGPKIDPCGTPQLTVCGFEMLPSTMHCCCLFNKYDLNQSRVVPPIP